MNKICPVMITLMVSLSLIFPYTSAAVELSTGKTMYVPVYRAFYYSYGSSKDASNLTTTVSLHNTDPKQVISVYAVEHYDSNGQLIKKILFEPIMIKPWSCKEIGLLPGWQSEEIGGHLIVRWKSDQPANPLLVEVLMVGQVLNRGASFLTNGQEVKE